MTELGANAVILAAWLAKHADQEVLDTLNRPWLAVSDELNRALDVLESCHMDPDGTPLQDWRQRLRRCLERAKE